MWSLISTMAFFLLPIFLVPFLVIKLQHTSKANQPPSPKKLPVIGNLHQLGFSPHRSLQSLSKQYGPLMLLHLGNVPVLIASSAEAAREIMKTHDLIFSSRPKLSIPDKLFYGGTDIAFAPYGEYWRNVRSICVLHLLSNKRVQSFRNVREEELSLMISRIKKASSSSSSSSGLVNLTDEINLLTNDIVCRVALGRKYSDGKQKMGKKFKKMLREMAALLGTFDVGDYLPWLAWINYFNGLDGRVKKLHQEFDEFLGGVLQDEKKKVQKGDRGSKNLVEILVQIQRENTLEFDIKDETIKTIIWDMFAGGTETTTTTLDWVMSELLRNPEIMHTLQEEVRQVARAKSSDLCEDDLANMPYLKAVIKETLRLHAPLPLLVPRIASQDINLMGYDIKAGTQVFINAWAIGRDPTYWENPEEFRPERFLDNNAIDFKGFDFEIIPFGAGRRGCPGSTFALVVVEIALAKLMHEFDFQLPDELKSKDLDMSESNGIAVQRRCPLLVATTTACGNC